MIPFETPEIEALVWKRKKIIERRRWKSHSPVMNYINALKSFYGNVSVPIVRTDGSEVEVNPYSYWCNGGHGLDAYAGAGCGDDSYGIQIGTSDDPHSLSDYCLHAKISQDYVDYGYTTVEGPVTVDDKKAVAIARTFYNKSPSDFSIKEVGMVMYTTSAGKFLIFRDVLSSPLLLSAGAGLTLRYIFTVYLP